MFSSVDQPDQKEQNPEPKTWFLVVISQYYSYNIFSNNPPHTISVWSKISAVKSQCFLMTAVGFGNCQA